MTFREAINSNKMAILKYLRNLLSYGAHTSNIAIWYGGDPDMRAVRKALNELRKEGKVKTDDRVHGYRGKFWQLVN